MLVCQELVIALADHASLDFHIFIRSLETSGRRSAHLAYPFLPFQQGLGAIAFS